METAGSFSRWRVTVALLAAAVAVAIPVGCGGEEDSSAQAAPVKCRRAEWPEPWDGGHYRRPEYVVGRDEDLIALVNTSCGPFRIALDSRRAPKTVSSFAKLAKNGFYESRAFDQITPGFIIQIGDPLGTATNSSGPGYSTTERPPAGFHYTRGMVAMSKRPSDPSGYSRSQFFIVLAPEAKLPAEYALIGRVDKGMEVVDRIGEFGDISGRPMKPVVIDWIWARKPTPKEEETGVMQLP